VCVNRSQACVNTAGAAGGLLAPPPPPALHTPRHTPRSRSRTAPSLSTAADQDNPIINVFLGTANPSVLTTPQRPPPPTAAAATASYQVTPNSRMKVEEVVSSQPARTETVPHRSLLALLGWVCVCTVSQGAQLRAAGWTLVALCISAPVSTPPRAGVWSEFALPRSAAPPSISPHPPRSTLAFALPSSPVVLPAERSRLSDESGLGEGRRARRRGRGRLRRWERMRGATERRTGRWCGCARRWRGRKTPRSGRRRSCRGSWARCVLTLPRRVLTLSRRALPRRVLTLSRRALPRRVLTLPRRVLTLSRRALPRRVLTLSRRALSRRVLTLPRRVLTLPRRVLTLPRRVLTLARRV
jgi:hypothetical protein